MIRILSTLLKGRDSFFIKGKNKNNWPSEMYKRNMVGKPAEYIKTETLIEKMMIHFLDDQEDDIRKGIIAINGKEQ